MLNYLPQEGFISRHSFSELIFENLGKIFCPLISLYLSIFQYICYFSHVTLLLLRSHKCQSKITQFLFQLQSPTSNTHITLLPFASLFYRNSTSKHVIRNQYFTVCSMHFLLLLPLQSSVSANPVAAQSGTPITFLNNLL